MGTTISHLLPVPPENLCARCQGPRRLALTHVMEASQPLLAVYGVGGSSCTTMTSAKVMRAYIYTILTSSEYS